MAPFEDSHLLYDPASERVIELNAPAAVVWHLCDGSRTLAEMVTLLAEAYPEDADRIAADVPDSVARLVEAGSLELAP